MVNLIHIVNNPSRCLQESYRILKDGGSLIAVDFTGYGMSLAKKIKLGFRYLRKWGLPPCHGRNDMSPDELVILAKSAGFRVVDVQLIEGGSNALYLNSRKR